MRKESSRITILVAEDDPDDRLLISDAFAEAQLETDLRFVEDGEELMHYLHHRGTYVDGREAPRPAVILLDLNMPRKDGREALEEIKSDPTLRRTPIVVLTTSKAEEDVLHSYDQGVSGFILKPVTFDALVDVLKTLGQYWARTVELPP